MVIAMFGGMIGEGVMKRGRSGTQYSLQRGRDFQQRWAYYLESLRSRRYSKILIVYIEIWLIYFIYPIPALHTLHWICIISGKFKKQSSHQRSSILEAIMISVNNLDETLEKRYKGLAVFLDDSSVPKKVWVCYVVNQ